jgi:hypothetical protein
MKIKRRTCFICNDPLDTAAVIHPFTISNILSIAYNPKMELSVVEEVIVTPSNDSR